MKNTFVYVLCAVLAFVLAGLALGLIDRFKLYVRLPFLHPSYFFTEAKQGVQGNAPSVLWMAPFFSGGGYSSEALSFASGLLAADVHNSSVRFKVAQHGDAISFDYVYGMNQTLINDLVLSDRKHDFTKE